MAQTTAVAPLRGLSGYLERQMPRIGQMALARHLTPERLVRVAVTAASRNPRLLECTPESFLLAIVEAGQLGLEPGSVLGQAYLIPFKNGKTGRYEVQFLPGYRGLADLVMRTGEIAAVDARAVFDGDEFEYDFGLEQKLIHQPCGESDPEMLTHSYVIFRYANGAVKFDVMTRREINSIRKRSKAKDDGPWVTDYVEMAKKTVVKRGVKLLRMSPELGAAIAKDDAAEMGLNVPLPQLDPAYGDPKEPEPKDPNARTGAVADALGVEVPQNATQDAQDGAEPPNEPPPDSEPAQADEPPTDAVSAPQDGESAEPPDPSDPISAQRATALAMRAKAAKIPAKEVAKYLKSLDCEAWTDLTEEKATDADNWLYSKEGARNG